MSTYTEKFRKAKSIKDKKQQEYIERYQLFNKLISSSEHPEYFDYDKTWEKIRNKLDAPLLKNAYYKIDNIVYFVKQNYYSEYEDINKRPHLLKMKGFKSYTIFDQDDINQDNIENPIQRDVYYENVLCMGIISSIKTSDCGSGEILYDLKNVIPECPESNPYVMEKNIITLKNFIF